MTRTRNPQKRIWWVVEVLEREESRGGEAEEVVEVVDRKCWTLHRRDSTDFSELVFVQGKIASNEMVRREIQSPSLLNYVLEPYKWSRIRRTCSESIHTAWRGKLGGSRCERFRFTGVVDRGCREEDEEDLIGPIL